ncbi:MAG: outer membrane beta-barrel protein [Chitinophagaceae bacterium]|nr:outer membrane beta-barrel protein [Chitinophagaceae bacterium]
MKKILFLLAVAVFFLQASGFSQKTRVGITAGITTANMYGTVNDKTLKDDSKTGITAGLIVDAPIGKSRFSFQPGVHYTQKGRTLAETGDDKSWLALRYADVHLNFLYNSKGKTTFFVGLGPSVGLDLPSYRVTKTSNATAANLDPDPEFSRSETKIKFGKDKLDDLKGLDYGFNMLGGFRTRKGYYFALNYTFGLRNIAANESGDDIKNGCFGFRIGYLFNNK